jgi:tetratricopeptide (TPR) repeat protein
VVAAVHQLKGDDSRTFGAVPAAREPEWWPYRLAAPVPFYGRLGELWDVRDALLADDHPGPPVVRIRGLGGQGKTLLAMRYAAIFAADHPGGVYVLQGFGSHRHTRGVPARIAALRADQLTAIATRLGLDVKDGAVESVEAALREYLAGIRDPYLWIVDDLPGGIDAQLCGMLLAPTSNGRTLVTTRNDVSYPWGKEVLLGELDEIAAVEFLTSRRPPADARDRRAAKDLASDLGRHALGLTVAAGLSQEPGFTGYERLRADIRSDGRDALAQSAALMTELPEDHAAGIAGTMLRSISKLGATARDVLRAASLLAPAPVPQPLLAAILTGGGWSPHELAAGLRETAGRSLAHAVGTPDGEVLWTVHALVSRTVRFADLDQGGRDDMRTSAVAALTTLLEGTQRTYARRELADYVPHVPGLVGDLVDESERHLLSETGRVQVELGDARAALSAFRDLHAACSRTLGDLDPTTLSVLGGLAAAYGLAGHHKLALELKQRAYEGLRAHHGSDHRDTLTLLNNIGVTYSDIGDHAAAREIYDEVYQARLRLLQAHHPDTLAALSNLAIAIGRSGDHQLARRLKAELCERSRRIHGQDHPLTLDALNNLAASEVALGNRATAHELFTRVYELRRALLGADHPDTLSARENAATTGDDARTRSILADLYRDRIDRAGPWSPESERTLRSLLIAISRDVDPGTLARERRCDLAPDPLPAGERLDEVRLGKVRLDDLTMDERVENFELAAAVHESMVGIHGPEHPETLVCRCLLAHALAAMNQLDRQFEDALIIVQDALEGLTEELGPYDPRTRMARSLMEWIKNLADSDE